MSSRLGNIIKTCGGLLALALLLGFGVDESYCQGSGQASTGTGGSHIIQGHVFFPSGRRAEGTIQVKLKSFVAGEISLFADASGSFTFSSLAPGSYTVEVSAGEDYEIARESVTIDSDVNLSRIGISTPSVSRRYTVMMTLQLKRSAVEKARVVDAVLAGVPDNARALYEKGLDAAGKGQDQNAIDNLRAAISLFPKFPLALNELGVEYIKTNQAQKALDPLQAAININPEAFMPSLNLGIALLETQQFVKAAAQLRQAALQKDSSASAHMYLGVALISLAKYQDAKTHLKRAIEFEGEQLGLAHYYLGGLYWQEREYRQAADELEAYLRLTPNARDAGRVRETIRELRAKS